MDKEKCPVCGCVHLAPVWHTSSGYGGLMSLHFCEECGCVFAHKNERYAAKNIRKRKEQTEKSAAAAEEAQRIKQELFLKLQSEAKTNGG